MDSAPRTQSLRQQEKEKFWSSAEARQAGNIRARVKMWDGTVEEVGAGADAGKVKVRLPGEVTPLADLPFAPVVGPMPAVSDQVVTLTDAAARRVITGDPAAGGAMTGEVKMWPVAVPEGYLECNGAVYDPVTYPDLFAVIGTTYGGTSGAPLLPDFRGRVPMGVGTGDAPDATANALAQKKGEEAVALVTGEMPAHAHGGNTGTGGTHTHGTDSPGNHTHTVSYSVNSNTTTGGAAGRVTGIETGTSGANQRESAGDGAHTHTANTTGSSHAHTIASEGSGTAHGNLQPSLGIRFIIKT